MDYSAAIIDIGAGASTFVDDLLLQGYNNVTLLDIAEQALLASKTRLGARAGQVNWLVADVTKVELAAHSIEDLCKTTQTKKKLLNRPNHL